MIILAVPYRVLDDVLRETGDGVFGKTLVDATNALTPDYQLAVGFTTSGAEELQKKAPRVTMPGPGSRSCRSVGPSGSMPWTPARS